MAASIFLFSFVVYFFKKKVVHKTFLLVHEFVDQMFCLSFFGSEIFVFFNSGSNFFLLDFFFVSKIFILIFFLSFLTNVYTKFCISTKYIHAKLFCLNKFA